MSIQNLLDVNTTFFTALSYPMSYLEFIGTIFTGLSVYLAAKNKLINWPIGIIGTILYGFLFYQVRLYSDLIEQVYYFITGFWGWHLWSHSKKRLANKTHAGSRVGYSHTNLNYIAVAITIVLSILLGYFMKNIHVIFPKFFPEPASFAYLDSATTVMSFVATIYLAKRKIESWYYWIIVDIIGIGLYYQKGVVFISLLYTVFLINAFFGLKQWRKIYEKQDQKEF